MARIFGLVGLVWVLPGVALAHSGVGVGDAASGFLHPLTGADHLLAMVAVGLWASQLGRPGLWLPVCFPLLMVVGAAIGRSGMFVPGTEAMIAGSLLVLGAAVVLAWRAPVGTAAVIVGGFAMFHGYAHGMEIPAGASPAVYAAGFVVATALLHGVGLGIGLLGRWPAGAMAVRVMGAGVAGLGGVLLFAGG